MCVDPKIFAAKIALHKAWQKKSPEEQGEMIKICVQ